MKALKFNAEMAQVVKDGRKTQTRRPIKGKADLSIVSYEGQMNSEIFKPEHRDKHLFLAEDGEWTCRPNYKIGDTHDVDGTQIKITGIRVERLQDISEEDATKEGAVRTKTTERHQEDGIEIYNSASLNFKLEIWDKLPYKPPYDWNSNPWVWVIEFEKVG